jgi:hypothetical protein
MRRILLLCGVALLAPATFLLGGGVALGSGSPVATTKAATAVTSTSATINGTVNPNGQDTTYAFQWGLTTSYGNETPVPQSSVGGGSTAAPVSANLSGLTSGTVYHYRVIASNASGGAAGADGTFTTTGTAPAAPTTTTSAATSVTANSAVLNGSVVPGATSVTCSFEYGLATTYGSSTAVQTVPAGTTAVAVNATIGGLASATGFHYRLDCTNATGTGSGADQTLTTLPTPGRIAIAGRRLFASPTGLVGVFVACFGGNPCTGTMTLKSGSRNVGPAAHYKIAPEKETVVFTRLTRRAFAQLKARHVLNATATATDTDGSKSVIPFRIYRELF